MQDAVEYVLQIFYMQHYSDFTKMFKLYTDALDVGLGAVLMQEDDQGKDRVICYEAKTLLPAERNYPTRKGMPCSNVSNAKVQTLPRRRTAI